ncbi:MAG: response regulator, partial [Silvanigrellaceae bacterium]|nr:response regulator [Silvanigrellaceae bacterium]
CGNSLLDLIEDILDFSKLEQNKLELKNRPMNLFRTIFDVIELLEVQASQKEIKIFYNFEKNVPSYIVGDQRRIKQILVNLISNAINFTEIGAIKLNIKLQEQMADDQLLIQFFVEDTGIGIRDDELRKLFLPFSQVDASTTRHFGGSGLGLSICKGLCEKMGGEIWVESVYGKGSTFFFTILTQITTFEKIQPNQELHPEFDSQMGKKYPLHILVAEDNFFNQIVILSLLEKLGYKADIVTNGKKVLEAIDKRKYDVILMDCHMPEMDGFEATKCIQKNFLSTSESRPKIIALSASTTKIDIDYCFQCGMDEFIGKPINTHSLKESLKNCFNKSNKKKQVFLETLHPNGHLPKIDFQYSSFDAKAFFKHFEGIEDIAFDALQLFLSHQEQFIQSVEDANQKKNGSQLQLAAHTLKGVLLNLYAKKASGICQDLEKMGENCLFENTNHLLIDLKIEIKNLIKIFNSLLQERDGL